ncbi:hypothetical protein [Desulfovirgula thermocuniculi]|uniref:hypothetical protein n=1 Tax=Desulfovirgula thermocuniculi TaxID=348842 RepID=UPI00041F1D12|nr:hypothetical protein [Desulfovirgula thermocuniculi]
MAGLELRPFDPREGGRKGARRPPDVEAALDLLRACERILPLLLDPSVSVREREALLVPARRLYLYLKALFEGGS